jgi:endonuclease/exonuclease/phosphatase family metal-dependent hydrolase
MTYNIHGGRGLDARIDLGRVAAVIEAFAPDIVALQEVDVGRPRSGGVDQAEDLARRLGLVPVFAPTIDNGDGRYGIATLTRLPVESQRQICLPAHRHRPTEPRCALVTKLRWDGGELEMINTHLSTLFRERPGQVAAIADTMAGEALVIAGDFNCTPWSPAYRVLSRRLQSATRFARTWPAPAPLVPIDHILYRGNLRAAAAGAWTGGPARMASDHLPVVAELQREVVTMKS